MFLIRWAVVALVFLGLTRFLPGIQVTSFWAGFWAAIVLSLVNTFIAPVLQLLALPVTVLTLGLFTFVINAFMILLVASIVPGFAIAGFGTALIVAICVTIVNSLL